MTSDDDRRGMPEFLPLSRPEGLQRRFRHISHRTGFRLSTDRLIAKPASAGKPPDGVRSSLPTGPPSTNGAAGFTTCATSPKIPTQSHPDGLRGHFRPTTLFRAIRRPAGRFAPPTRPSPAGCQHPTSAGWRRRRFGPTSDCCRGPLRSQHRSCPLRTASVSGVHAPSAAPGRSAGLEQYLGPGPREVVSPPHPAPETIRRQCGTLSPDKHRMEYRPRPEPVLRHREGARRHHHPRIQAR